MYARELSAARDRRSAGEAQGGAPLPQKPGSGHESTDQDGSHRLGLPLLAPEPGTVLRTPPPFADELLTHGIMCVVGCRCSARQPLPRAASTRLGLEPSLTSFRDQPLALSGSGKSEFAGHTVINFIRPSSATSQKSVPGLRVPSGSTHTKL